MEMMLIGTLRAPGLYKTPQGANSTSPIRRPRDEPTEPQPSRNGHAREAGETARKRGRPPKYLPEQRQQAHIFGHKDTRRKHKERVAQTLIRLEEMHAHIFGNV